MHEASLHQLAEQLGQLLKQAGLMLATAESCTGGGIAKICTDVIGSSAWFDCGLVAYSNTAKQTLLEVSPQSLQEYGAVSEVVVKEMALGALKLSNAQVIIAVSGIAGPTGGSAYKPVGTVCMAWQIKEQKSLEKTYYFQGDRLSIREQVIAESLRNLIALLQ